MTTRRSCSRARDEPVEQAAALLAAGAKTAIVTCGARGAVAARGRQRWRCGAYDMPIVDPSGCGDAFAAGLVTGVVRGWECLESSSTPRRWGVGGSRRRHDRRRFSRRGGRGVRRGTPLDQWRNGVQIDVKMPDLAATEGSDISVKRWLITVGCPGQARATAAWKSKPTRRRWRSNRLLRACLPRRSGATRRRGRGRTDHSDDRGRAVTTTR